MPENTAPRISSHARCCVLSLTLTTLLGVLGPHQSWAAEAQASKYYEDALIRYEKKDRDGAIIQLKNALQIDKNMLPVQMLLGKALLQNGDVAADVAFTEALRLGVNCAEVVVPLGQVYLAQGKQKLILGQPKFSLAGLPTAVQLEPVASLRCECRSVRPARRIEGD